ncbi:hypothetical protein TUZN_0485 [Thermoproteus uzoniensis 768-20]|uniref:Uncharacterized protein n=1 Tax=Thermoproteus uzoniensis (strain 768-20) TaxID=999630 RepID=F2L3C2_THEU7|nr:hypothetical protein TUZN_0485 [Thermoproteus uzoniensis 768-20]
MISHVALQLGERKISGELTPLTFVTGSGKSVFINSIYLILSNIGSKIPKIYYNKFSISIKINNKVFSLQKNGKIYRQIFEDGGRKVAIEYGVLDGSRISRVMEPFELAIKNADILMPQVDVAEHVSILADEEVEEVNRLLGEFRKTFSLKAILLGPYIDPKTFHDAAKATGVLKPDGSNLVGVLARLALKAPDAYDRLRASFRKKGIKLAVGLARGGVLAGVAYIGGAKIPISRLPCSLKAALALATAVIAKPDLLLVDNFDYCFNENVAEILSSYLNEQISRGQIVAEIHRPDIAELFKIQYKSILSVSL